MPAVRTVNTYVKDVVANASSPHLDLQRFAFGSSGKDAKHSQAKNTSETTMIDFAFDASKTIAFPKGEARSSYRRKDGKKVTPHQWAVYDFILNIPCGKVSTYKQICDALGEGSPRSVGSALRNNPFAPFVPCHRVIASDLNLGGFLGEWGTEKTNGSRCARKLDMLTQEGVEFSPEGKMKYPDECLWRIPPDPQAVA